MELSDFVFQIPDSRETLMGKRCLVWDPGPLGPWGLGPLGPWAPGGPGPQGPWDLGTLGPQGPWDPGTLGPSHASVVWRNYLK